MSALRDIAIRWYRKAFGAPAGSDIREEGLDTVLDGNIVLFCCNLLKAGKYSKEELQHQKEIIEEIEGE